MFVCLFVSIISYLNILRLCRIYATNLKSVGSARLDFPEKQLFVQDPTSTGDWLKRTVRAAVEIGGGGALSSIIASESDEEADGGGNKQRKRGRKAVDSESEKEESEKREEEEDGRSVPADNVSVVSANTAIVCSTPGIRDSSEAERADHELCVSSSSNSFVTQPLVSSSEVERADYELCVPSSSTKFDSPESHKSWMSSDSVDEEKASTTGECSTTQSSNQPESWLTNMPRLTITRGKRCFAATNWGIFINFSVFI